MIDEVIANYSSACENLQLFLYYFKFCPWITFSSNLENEIKLNDNFLWKEQKRDRMNISYNYGDQIRGR
jgi:hypothetical protein